MEACSCGTLIGSSGETACSCYRIASHEIYHIRQRSKLINSFVNELWRHGKEMLFLSAQELNSNRTFNRSVGEGSETRLDEKKSKLKRLLFSLQGRDSFQFCAQKKKFLFMLVLLTLLI